MFKTSEGSTGRLIQLCAGYFFFYIITGVTVKFFLNTDIGFPALHGIEYLIYSTVGGALITTPVVLFLKWYKLDSIKQTHYGSFSIPSELLYIIPSGLLTAVIVPTTTLMYSFKGISVMVAMVLMRGAVIIIGRVVDSIQIKQGILNKKVYWEENVATFFALIAVTTKFFSNDGSGKNPFSSLPVILIFSAYIAAYSFRIYIMNYYKNTRPKKTKVNNNKAFYAIEQITVTITLFLVFGLIVLFAKSLNIEGPRITPALHAIFSPDPRWWHWAILAGGAFGIVSFFSVFIFMFKGRTATFSGLVNRITSLIAGTVSTIIFAFYFGGKYPNTIDWILLFFIFISVGFITKAERKRSKELKQYGIKTPNN
jgi:hypothetical protein